MTAPHLFACSLIGALALTTLQAQAVDLGEAAGWVLDAPPAKNEVAQSISSWKPGQPVSPAVLAQMRKRLPEKDRLLLQTLWLEHHGQLGRTGDLLKDQILTPWLCIVRIESTLASSTRPNELRLLELTQELERVISTAQGVDVAACWATKGNLGQMLGKVDDARNALHQAEQSIKALNEQAAYLQSKKDWRIRVIEKRLADLHKAIKPPPAPAQPKPPPPKLDIFEQEYATFRGADAAAIAGHRAEAEAAFTPMAKDAHTPILMQAARLELARCLWNDGKTKQAQEVLAPLLDEKRQGPMQPWAFLLAGDIAWKKGTAPGTATRFWSGAMTSAAIVERQNTLGALPDVLRKQLFLGDPHPVTEAEFTSPIWRGRQAGELWAVDVGGCPWSGRVLRYQAIARLAIAAASAGNRAEALELIGGLNQLDPADAARSANECRRGAPLTLERLFRGKSGPSNLAAVWQGKGVATHWALEHLRGLPPRVARCWSMSMAFERLQDAAQSLEWLERGYSLLHSDKLGFSWTKLSSIEQARLEAPYWIQKGHLARETHRLKEAATFYAKSMPGASPCDSLWCIARIGEAEAKAKLSDQMERGATAKDRPLLAESAQLYLAVAKKAPRSSLAPRALWSAACIMERIQPKWVRPTALLCVTNYPASPYAKVMKRTFLDPASSTQSPERTRVPENH